MTRYDIDQQIPESTPSQRLDTYLTTLFDGQYSRSWIASMIKEHGALIDGKSITKPGAPVLAGQHLQFTMPPPPCFSLTPHPVAFDVIAEHKDFLVVNKPAGLAVHYAASAPDAITLVHGLLDRYPEFANFEEHERPGIVHRLDKDTSGLIIIARNKSAQTRLARLFHDRKVKKIYHALVKGYPDRIFSSTESIGRDSRQRHKMSAGGIAPRTAHTDFSVLSYYEDELALVEARPVTGRTHQIRVHAAHCGFPLVGDVMYGSPSSLIARHALHAYQISFEYRGVQHSYLAPYPADFEQMLKGLTVAKTAME